MNMSFDDSPRCREGPPPQRDAHGADGARHDHRRRRGDRDGGHRHRRAHVDREADPERRVEHHDGQCRLRRLWSRAAGSGRRDHAHRRTTRRRSRAGAGHPLPVADAEHARRRSSPRSTTGTRRSRAPTSSSPDIRSWPMQFGSVLHRRRTCAARRRSPSSALSRAISCLATARIPSGQLVRINNQPFRVIGVLAQQGPGGHGPGSGRHGHRSRTRPCRRSCSACSTSSGITISAAGRRAARRDLATQIATICCASVTSCGAGADDDFMVRTQAEMATMLTSTTTR